MAGDWIKMRTDLYRDPKVCLMAEKLLGVTCDGISNVTRNVTRNTMRNACVGALLSVWGVMRHRGVRNGDDLACYGVGLWVLDDISDMPLFGDAMESVGWVVENDQGLIFPRFFDEYNVEPDGKNKSKNAERQARYREKKRLGVDAKSNVTSNVTRNVTVTPREEERERREEINPPLPPKGEPSKPSKRKPKATQGEWIIPQGMNQAKILEALGHFEEMRKSKGKPIANRENLSRIFPSFDDEAHLLYAITFATANEYQGVKVDYRPPLQPGLPFGQDPRRKPLEVRPERCFQ